ncbi:hypothetical protein B0T25DRAFT_141999 [Lasiosphaeria hispida]|uniref:Zn(2)-C6 fungal-type domain-containing protein n=1 Tax=Lasiosphaeria hispida TaxID=260671 RepID=A0AAJ0HL58_9PEZI|nr:hypothetical protein B0T25DRAFT_141999 [Lasiosphaeria hispida]
MVGVPGKYRGCETCRSRRVKCGNERPYCKRCVDSHRECTYERETVFIVASIEDGGRCSSHPPRRTAKKSKAAPKVQEEERLELVVSEPLLPAWNDLVSVSNRGKRYSLQVAVLNTVLQSVFRGCTEDDSDGGSSNRSAPISFATYETPDIQPSLSDDDFQLRSRSMVHFSPPAGMHGEERTQADGIFLFLYEHNNSIASPANVAHWRDVNSVRRQGPESYRLFPAHHFFVRVYRHNAICAALLNRKPSFLAEPAWTAGPWEFHQKSNFDHLLDTIALLPGTLARADRTFTQDQTLARRLMAQDLLSNCINIESLFDRWYGAATSMPDVLWIEDPDGTDAQIPFADTFAFCDSLTAVAFIYYWMAQLLFYPCIERLYWTIFEPVVDGPFPQTMPVLPGNLQINPLKYSMKEVREIASNICRSLDFALIQTAQPDMLAVPLFVVCQFYQHVGLDMHGGGDDEVFGDGRLELIWCEAFRARLAAKGRDMQEVVQVKQWKDLASF